MLRPLLFLIFMLLMGSVIYLFFFTQVVDRILMRLKLGKRAKSLETTAAALDDSVRSTVSDLRREQLDVAEAIKTASAISNRPLTQAARTLATHPYVIRSICRNSDAKDYLYWSNTLGWTILPHADRFDLDETKTHDLPMGGRWLRQRQPSKRPQ